MDSFIFKVFTAKYFPDGKAILGSRPSFAWRSIYRGKLVIDAMDSRMGPMGQEHDIYTY